MIYTYYGRVNFFSWHDICKSKGLNEINWDKCIRTFSSQWSLVINKKLCIMIVSPILIVFFNYFKRYAIIRCNWLYLKIRHRNMLYNNKSSGNGDDFDGSQKPIQIKGDLEYAMFGTKCESMIIWFPISPIVIPLTALSMYTNYYIYNLMIEKYNWQFIPFDIHIKFPIQFICISILVSQFYTCVFMFVCIDNQLAFYILMISLIILDIFYSAKYYYFHKYGKEYVLDLSWNYNCCNHVKSVNNTKSEPILIANEYERL